MPTITLDIEVEVYCANCNAGLCMQTRVGRAKGQDALYVEPCSKCDKESRQNGYEEGRAEAERED